MNRQKWLIVTGIILVPLIAQAQRPRLSTPVTMSKRAERMVDDGEDFRTANTLQNNYFHTKKKKEKKIYFIYVDKPNKVLYMNPCVTEFTREMGFEYAHKFDLKNSEDVIDREVNWHNYKVGWKLFWRNGPFWKRRLKKRMKQCLHTSGDFTN
jgi:hypothetical protein